MGAPFVLNRAARVRRDFNPAVAADVDEMRHYIEHSRWRSGCPFNLIGNYADVPYQCLTLWAKHSLNGVQTA